MLVTKFMHGLRVILPAPTAAVHLGNIVRHRWNHRRDNPENTVRLLGSFDVLSKTLTRVTMAIPNLQERQFPRGHKKSGEDT